MKFPGKDLLLLQKFKWKSRVFFFSSNPKRVNLGIKRPKPPDRVSVSIFCSQMLNSDLLFMEHTYFKGKKKYSNTHGY